MTRQTGLSGVDEAVGRSVVLAHQRGAGIGLLDDGLVPEQRRHQVGGQDEVLVAQTWPWRIDVRADGRGHVGDEGPGRGGPDQQRHRQAVLAAGTGARPVRGGAIGDAEASPSTSGKRTNTEGSVTI